MVNIHALYRYLLTTAAILHAKATPEPIADEHVGFWSRQSTMVVIVEGHEIAVINTGLSFATTHRQLTWIIAATEQQQTKRARKQSVRRNSARTTRPAAPDNRMDAGVDGHRSSASPLPTFEEIAAPRGRKRREDREADRLNAAWAAWAGPPVGVPLPAAAEADLNAAWAAAGPIASLPRPAAAEGHNAFALPGEEADLRADASLDGEIGALALWDAQDADFADLAPRTGEIEALALWENQERPEGQDVTAFLDAFALPGEEAELMADASLDGEIGALALWDAQDADFADLAPRAGEIEALALWENQERPEGQDVTAFLDAFALPGEEAELMADASLDGEIGALALPKAQEWPAGQDASPSHLHKPIAARARKGRSGDRIPIADVGDW